MCRAARSEAEGWKARTLHADSQIAELKLQVKDYRMQLGLPIECEDAGAGPPALTWHKPDSGAATGEQHDCPPIEHKAWWSISVKVLITASCLSTKLQGLLMRTWRPQVPKHELSLHLLPSSA